MNAEEALQLKVKKPDLLVLGGSRLYGTARYDDSGNCLSDTDLRGVIIPPWEYLTTRTMEQTKIPGEVDGLVYSIGFFIKQLIAANPQHLEILHAPPQCIISITEVGKSFSVLREMAVSKRFYKRIFGFSNSEFRKARGVELEKTERTKDEDAVINDIRNVFGPHFGNDQKEVMDDILSLLFSHHERKEVSSRDRIQGKRVAEFEKYGYGVSSATHAVRLARQCTELLKTGTMTFPRPDAPQLSEIKHGKVSLEQVEKWYKEAMEEAEAAVTTSTLQDVPNIKGIKSFWEETVAKALLSDVRLESHGPQVVVTI